jgi:acetoin utilization deacetylase AcuC-like enzyme
MTGAEPWFAPGFVFTSSGAAMPKGRNRLGIVFFPAFDWAISPTHPEREERLLYTQDQFREEGIFDLEGIGEYRPDLAETLDVARVHFCFPDVSSVISPSHLVSAGGAMRTARLILEGERDKGFALIRPPGHHAMKVVHGARGFCNINIEAIMLEWIRETYGHRRVAIVDTDCHHGDGTQDIYWHDPDTLFISMHQDGRTIFPGTGFPYESGGPKAAGRTINVPLPPGTSDKGFLHVIDHLVLPILEDFKPDLVINSAGQDNHYSDPITNMNFSAQGYALLNDKLNPHIAVLEGGYSIQGALPYINLGIALAMAGMDYSGVREPNFDPQRIRQSDQISEYIPKLCDAILNLYRDPPTEREEWVLKDGFYVRSKEIFYDTDQITEHQVESLRDCPDCRGWIRYESTSNRNPKSLGVEVPLTACARCEGEGRREYAQACEGNAYFRVQLINRRSKEYLHHPVTGGAR